MKKNDEGAFLQNPEDEDLPLEVTPEDFGQRPAGHPIFKALVGRAFYIPLVMLLVFSGGIIGMYFQPPGLQKFFEYTGLTPGAGSKNPIAVSVNKPSQEQTENQNISKTDVVALGRLLPEHEIITVSPPFGAGDARISKILVEEGQEVASGDIIAVLDNLSSLESRVRSAEALLAVREANLAQTREAIATNKTDWEAKLEKAKSVLKTAKEDLQRSQELFKRGIVTRAALDKAKAKTVQAGRDVDSAKAAYQRFSSKTLDQQSDVIVALRNVEAARADLERARHDLNQAYIRSPSSGRVLSVNVQPGGKSGKDGVAKIGDLQTMKVEVEVFQSLIGKVKLGQAVSISGAALNEPIQGTVTKIGWEVSPQTITTDDPAAITDARVVKVTVILDDASSKKAARFTNLEVVARIKVADPA